MGNVDSSSTLSSDDERQTEQSEQQSDHDEFSRLLADYGEGNDVESQRQSIRKVVEVLHLLKDPILPSLGPSVVNSLGPVVDDLSSVGKQLEVQAVEFKPPDDTQRVVDLLTSLNRYAQIVAGSGKEVAEWASHLSEVICQCHRVLTNRDTCRSVKNSFQFEQFVRETCENVAPGSNKPVLCMLARDERVVRMLSQIKLDPAVYTKLSKLATNNTQPLMKLYKTYRQVMKKYPAITEVVAQTTDQLLDRHKAQTKFIHKFSNRWPSTATTASTTAAAAMPPSTNVIKMWQVSWQFLLSRVTQLLMDHVDEFVAHNLPGRSDKEWKRWQVDVAAVIQGFDSSPPSMDLEFQRRLKSKHLNRIVTMLYRVDNRPFCGECASTLIRKIALIEELVLDATEHALSSSSSSSSLQTWNTKTLTTTLGPSIKSLHLMDVAAIEELWKQVQPYKSLGFVGNRVKGLIKKKLKL